LAHNPQQAVFITGPDIAVVAVDVDYARVCNNQDKVSNWSTEAGWDGDKAPGVSP